MLIYYNVYVLFTWSLLPAGSDRLMIICRYMILKIMLESFHTSTSWDSVFNKDESNGDWPGNNISYNNGCVLYVEVDYCLQAGPAMTNAVESVSCHAPW